MNRSMATTPTTLILRGWTEGDEIRVVVTEISGDDPPTTSDPPAPRLVASVAALSAEVERWAARLVDRRAAG